MDNVRNSGSGPGEGPEPSHGTVRMYREFRCRCRTCVKGQERRVRTAEAVREAKAERTAVAGMPHGVGRYRKGCRCAVCRKALSVHVTQLKAARIAQGIPEGVGHGLATTYSNWNCRCVACRDAYRIRERDRKAGYRLYAQSRG